MLEMVETVREQHSAGAAALGYLYQCRCALLEALKQSEIHPGLEVSVERFDDIAFDEDDDPKILIQTKHRVTRFGDLGDLSSDLWKTLSIWSKQVSKDPQFPFRVRLLLITTANAPENSAASLLRNSDRDEDLAHHKLLAARERSRATSRATLSSFAAFTDLPTEQRSALLHAITVLDRSPNIQDIEEEISQKLIRSTKRERVPLLVERLEGWWFGKIVDALVDGRTSISMNALEGKIDEIREGLVDNSLPVDFLTAEPPEAIVADSDRRPFVQQLRLINVREPRIRFAVRDYYRASEQRSRWVREDLLADGELDGYDQQLRETWEPRFYRMVEGLDDDCGESERITAGEALYAWVETDVELPLRTVNYRFLSQGSLHILSNRRAIGWHPDYLQRVGAIDGESN